MLDLESTTDLHHEMNSDVCPVPGTGAVYDQRKVLDLRTNELKEPLSLFTAQRVDYSHFSVVRTKLKWSGALGEDSEVRTKKAPVTYTGAASS